MNPSDKPADRRWADLTDDERDLLAWFLMAVNSDVALSDGRMTRREADVDKIFQPVLARSRGDLVREALFRLHDHQDDLAARYLDMSNPGVGPFLTPVLDVLRQVDGGEMRRYVVAVFHIGLATAQADGPLLGSKMSGEESATIDAIMYSLGLPLAGSEATLERWLASGDPG